MHFGTRIIDHSNRSFFLLATTQSQIFTQHFGSRPPKPLEQIILTPSEPVSFHHPKPNARGREVETTNF